MQRRPPGIGRGRYEDGQNRIPHTLSSKGPGRRKSRKSIYKPDSFKRNVELDRFATRAYTCRMSEQVGVSGPAGTRLPPMAGRTRGAVQRGWEPPPKKLSLKDSVSAGAFLVFYLVAYLMAGFAGVTFMEWAWMQVFR